MRRLSLLIIAASISAISIRLTILEGAFSPLVNFSIIPIIIAGLVDGLGFSLTLSVITVTSILLMGILGAKAHPLFVTFCVVSAAPFIVRYITLMLQGYKRTRDSEFDQIKMDHEQLRREGELLKGQNQELEGRVSETANLYEVTKEMSATLELTDAVSSLSESLNKTFDFTRCHLLLLLQRNGEFYINKTCIIEKIEDEKAQDSRLKFNEPPPDYSGGLVDRIKSEKIPVQFSASVIAAPLLIENRLRGILAIEDMDASNLEKFVILANQFSLVLGKIQLYEEVQALAIIDGLTGIYVRRHFMERFNEELERAIRHNSKLSAFLLDIDHFKRHNDTFGHLVGDVVLKDVATILKKSIREVDLLGRYGGEEFAVILLDTDKNGALAVGERIRSTIENYTFRAYDEVVKTTVSIGISSFPDGAKDTQELIEEADEAMYRAKKAGRNKVCVH